MVNPPYGDKTYRNIPNTNNSNPNNVGQDYKSYYAWMNEQLSVRIVSLATALLGNPVYRRPREWRYGDKEQLVIHVSGERQGWFHNFETGESGDALQLVANNTGHTGKALSDWVKGFIGHIPDNPHHGKSEWTPVVPVPPELLGQGIDISGMSDFGARGMKETARYCYRDRDGKVRGFVVRVEGLGHKITLPLTWCQNERGDRQWRWKGFPVPRTPYGAELLQNLEQPVLVVEGEKTAEAARGIFPDMVVLSWAAGSASVHLTDWSILAGRDVVLWPDHDRVGHHCMDKLQGILRKVGAASVYSIQLPPDTPPKWDLADPLPEGWTMDRLHELVQIHGKENRRGVC